MSDNGKPPDIVYRDTRKFPANQRETDTGIYAVAKKKKPDDEDDGDPVINQPKEGIVDPKGVVSNDTVKNEQRYRKMNFDRPISQKKPRFGGFYEKDG